MRSEQRVTESARLFLPVNYTHAVKTAIISSIPRCAFLAMRNAERKKKIKKRDPCPRGDVSFFLYLHAAPFPREFLFSSASFWPILFTQKFSIRSVSSPASFFLVNAIGVELHRGKEVRSGKPFGNTKRNTCFAPCPRANHQPTFSS